MDFSGFARSIPEPLNETDLPYPDDQNEDGCPHAEGGRGREEIEETMA